MNKYLKLAISLIVPFLAASIGSIFTAQSSWYVELAKPAFQPPNWIFGPVWTLLYLLMGISLFLVWQKGFESMRSKIALFFFSIQLFFNALWSVLFFGLNKVMFAFVDIIALWAAIALTMVSFYRISKTSMYLLIPYFLWVTFAMILNFSLFVLN